MRPANSQAPPRNSRRNILSRPSLSDGWKLEKPYLLKSENMKRRLLEANNRPNGIPFEEALAKLAI